MILKDYIHSQSFFLSKEFLFQFKTGEAITAFMKELHTHVYEQILETGLDNLFRL